MRPLSHAALADGLRLAAQREADMGVVHILRGTDADNGAGLVPEIHRERAALRRLQRVLKAHQAGHLPAHLAPARGRSTRSTRESGSSGSGFGGASGQDRGQIAPGDTHSGRREPVYTVECVDQQVGVIMGQHQVLGERVWVLHVFVHQEVAQFSRFEPPLDILDDAQSLGPVEVLDLASRAFGERL